MRGGMKGARVGCDRGICAAAAWAGSAAAESVDDSSSVSTGEGGRSLNSARARSSSVCDGACSSSSGIMGRSRSSAACSASRSAWACASTWATSAAVRLRLDGLASTTTGAGSALTARRRPFLAAGSSALFRFSRSQRTRTADTWSCSRAERWLRTKIFISLSMPRSCSGATPNSAARSCTLVLTTHSSIRSVRAPGAPCRRPMRGPAHLPP